MVQCCQVRHYGGRVRRTEAWPVSWRVISGLGSASRRVRSLWRVLCVNNGNGCLTEATRVEAKRVAKVVAGGRRHFRLSSAAHVERAGAGAAEFTFHARSGDHDHSSHRSCIQRSTFHMMTLAIDRARVLYTEYTVCIYTAHFTSRRAQAVPRAHRAAC